MRWLAACFAGFILGLPAQAPGAPLEAYGRLATLENVQISPDGTRIAFVLTSGEDRRVLVQSLTDHKLLAGLKAGKVKLRDVQWADSDHLVITNSVSGQAEGVISKNQEWFMAEVFDVVKGLQHPLLENLEESKYGSATPADAMNVIYGAPEVRVVDGHTLLFVQGQHFESGEGTVALIKVDIAAKRSVIIEDGAPSTADWLVDAAGKPVAETRYEETSGKWSLRIRKPDGNWMLSRSVVAPIDPPGLGGLGRDGKSVVVRILEDGKSVLHEVSTTDGAWGPPIADPYDELIHDGTTHALVGGMDLEGDELTYAYFDPARQKHWKAVTKAFPGEQVTLVSASADANKLVVLVDGPKDGAAFSLVDLNTKHADWIGDQYDQVTPNDIAEVRAISYKAADGVEISGYLTLPRGKPAKDLPLVVLPHGGPAARDTPGFEWWSQALASRGYAVLRPNFRGSSGLGADLLEAGYGQWGRKMQTDLSDGVRYLAGQGLIDPKRVCVVGASYGGYAAMAGPTLDPGVYRCAVAVSGISDLKRFLKWRQGYFDSKNNMIERYWDRFLGVKADNDPMLDTLSPARLANRVTVPMLLIHGKDDTVVPYEQSQIMADALTRAGKPVTLVTLAHEDHWLSRSETRLQMLTATVAFLEANNPPN